MVVAMLLAGALIVGIGRLGATADDAARARTAADAAALAGAADGYDAALRLAQANGAILLDFQNNGDIVEATTQVGESVAVAAAMRTVVWEQPVSQ